MEYFWLLVEVMLNVIVVFGDDGEKFGIWFDMKSYVYENGWLY